MNYDQSVRMEIPMSEGDQIKSAIRELFCSSREGAVYDEANPLRKHICGVNGSGQQILCLHKHPERHGAVVMWYEDV